MRRLSLPRLRLWWERAFWVIPLTGVLLGAALQQVTVMFDEAVGSVVASSGTTLVSTTAAGQVLGAIGGGMVTFTGFVFSFVVLVLQFGSSQYSPRTVSYFLRARSTQWILAVFLLTITFSFLSLLEIGSLGRDDFAPQAGVAVAVVLLFVSLVGFIVLLHSIGRRVRVDAVLFSLGRQARRQFPRRLAAPSGAGFDGDVVGEELGAAEPVRHLGRTGQVVAIDGRRLVRLAARHRLTIRLLVRVGDSVTRGTPVMKAAPRLGRRVARAAARSVVVDVERSLLYDPMYSLRLVVDVALRALSPGVNDPTTAVRALDEIEQILRTVAELPLGSRTLTGGRGRVVVRGPAWSDVLDLALVEVLEFGRGQPQVTRRLAALLDDLLADVADDRVAPVRALRDRLVEAVTRAAEDEDLARIALVADRQGIGGMRPTPGCGPQPNTTPDDLGPAPLP